MGRSCPGCIALPSGGQHVPATGNEESSAHLQESIGIGEQFGEQLFPNKGSDARKREFSPA